MEGLKRKEQKELRERDILIKSLRFFVTKGYRETKITDIAESVGMSVGLLFHYFPSKEDLYYRLVQMGVETSKRPEALDNLPPIKYFEETLKQLFKYAENEPWVFQMFVLMNQAQKENVPERIRKLARSVNQIDFSAEIIRRGQKDGTIRDGDPDLLSSCFWASVQGVMEQMASSKKPRMPNSEWLIAILKNN